MSKIKFQFDSKKFADVIAEISKSKCLNQTEIAELLGIGKSSLSLFLNGRTSVSKNVIEKTCEVSGGKYTVDYFVRHSENQTTNENENGDNIGGGSGNTYNINSSKEDEKRCKLTDEQFGRIMDILGKISSQLESKDKQIGHCLDYIDDLKKERDELRKQLYK